MRSLPVLLVAALVVVGCGNNVVSGSTSSSTGGAGSTGSTGSGASSGTSGSTGTSGTGSSGSTGGSGSGSTSGTTLPRPTYPAPTGNGYSVSIGHVIQNYTFTGYVSQTSGVVDNTATWNQFSLQDIRNLVQSGGTPFRYLLLDFAAGWCVPCNDEADEYGTTGTNSGKVGEWLAKGGLYVTVLVQNYNEGNPSSPVQTDVNTWLSAHNVQSTLSGDVDGVLFGSISQSAFPANLVIDLDTMQIEDAWYGLDDGKIASSWEAKLNAP